MQWKSEQCSKEELLLLLKPLRACNIIENKIANENWFTDDKVEVQQEIKRPKVKKKRQGSLDAYDRGNQIYSGAQTYRNVQTYKRIQTYRSTKSAGGRRPSSALCKPN
jgi:hypothetical protein